MLQSSSKWCLPVGLHDHSWTKVLVTVPPVAGARCCAARTQDAVNHIILHNIHSHHPITAPIKLHPLLIKHCLSVTSCSPVMPTPCSDNRTNNSKSQNSSQQQNSATCNWSFTNDTVAMRNFRCTVVHHATKNRHNILVDTNRVYCRQNHSSYITRTLFLSFLISAITIINK